jgi:hypothetical protein
MPAAEEPFFPSKGPGIVNLAQQEVRFLEMLSKQIKEGVTIEQALKNMNRAMTGQKYTVSAHMQTALSSLASRLGYSGDELGRAIASRLPASAEAVMPAEAEAAAKAKSAGRPYRFVKWGGRALLVVGIGIDAADVYFAENKPKVITEKAGAWAGAWAGAKAGAWGGAKAGAAIAVGLGFAGPQAAAPEEVVTVPVGGLIGGIVGGLAGGIGGYIGGGKVTKAICEWTFE